MDLRKLVFLIGCVFLLAILGVVGWFFAFVYEGETKGGWDRNAQDDGNVSQPLSESADRTRKMSKK